VLFVGVVQILEERYKIWTKPSPDGRLLNQRKTINSAVTAICAEYCFVKDSFRVTIQTTFLKGVVDLTVSSNSEALGRSLRA